MRPALTIQIALILFVMISFPNLFAQDTIVVEPGIGTLETAINQHGGDVIYQLIAGEQYILDGIINVIPQVLGGLGKTLTIVGEKTDGMPPIITVGRQNNSSPYASMFSCSANLTLKNLFLTDKDLTGAFGLNVISINAPIRVVVEGCVIDPAGTKRTFNGEAAANGSCLYLTNSQIYRNGSMDTPNDGGWLGGMQWDTLWVENNTLVSSGQDFIGGSFHREPNNQFIWINHNTIMWHDVWIKKSFNDQNFYFTNNLLHDQSLFPELPRWYPFFPDFEDGNNLLCQTAIDTLEIGGVPETLPSERRMFWEYNLMYYSPKLQEVPKYAADNGLELTYLLPMLWDDDVPLSYTGGIVVGSPEDSCRENRILADKVNWPHMKYKNNWYDLDPLYNDPMIYQINDSAGEHILGFYRGQFWNEPDAPAVEDLPSYNWDIDAYNGYNPADPPTTWPRFDASYTNPGLLSASLEGLPIGDLNWYPDQKFQWYANKEMIESHILDLNEDQFDLRDPETISYRVKFIILDLESNPIEGVIMVIGSDTIGVSAPDGRIAFDTISGRYSYTLMAFDYAEVHGDFAISYSSYSNTITMESTVGVSEREELTSDESSIRIYPNPANKFLVIEAGERVDGTIQIINILGAICEEVSLHSNRAQISLEGLSGGLYIVRIAGMNQQHVSSEIFSFFVKQ